MNETFQRAVQSYRQGDFKSAKAACERLLRKQAASEQVLLLLAAIQVQTGEPSKAGQVLRRALALNPGSDAACYMLGNLAREAGDLNEAVDWYGRALSANPGLGDAWINLGISQDALGRVEDALASYDTALTLNPAHPLALFNRGNVLRSLGRFRDAVGSYEAALSGWQGGPDLRFNLGNALLETDDLEQAEVQFRRVLVMDARHRGALLNLAVTLRRSGKPGAAWVVLDDAAGWLSADPEWLALRGRTAGDLGQQAEAVRCLNASTQLRAQSAETWFALGSVFSDSGQWIDARHALHQTIALDPGSVRYRAALLRVEMETWDLDAAASSWKQVSQLDAPNEAVHLDVVLATTDDPHMQLRFAAGTAAALGVGAVGHAAASQDREISISSVDRPRLAYLSPDFGDHPVGFSIVELLERHDRTRFETIGLSLARRPPSPVAERIRNACTRFIDVSDKSFAETDQLIRDLGVSIAVDLGGFTTGARPKVLAGRPAPIQVGYLGFAHTTGAQWLDYLMADAVAIPPEWDHAHTEKIVRLPGCFFPTDATSTPTPELPGGRLAEGLPADAVVLCCFNTPARISKTIFDVWMRTLARVPQAVLWLRSPNDEARKRILARAESHGVDPARLVFARFVAERSEHLARHRLADLYLDTFPYNSHSTARDALQMGVPLVTIRGRAFASRVGASMLVHLGLDDLVSENEQDYEDRVWHLAKSAELRTRYVSGLREAAIRSRFFDMSQLAHTVETAYQTMLELYQRGESPRSFSLLSDEVLP